LQHREAGIASGEETLAATLARFEQREVTLLDTLQTEDALTADQLRLVEERLAYASTFARLRFETGELVTAAAEWAAGKMLTFQAAGLAAPPGALRREEPR
jgi:anti-sigma-K factor RskA